MVWEVDDQSLRNAWWPLDYSIMQKVSVLIVDDNHQMRRTLRSFLADLTDQFYECSDGAQALAAYAVHHPDLVLMDIKMNAMDGLAATAEIVAAFPQAKIVIVTNYDDAELQRAARRAGAWCFVKKSDLMPLRSLITDGPDFSEPFDHR